MRPDDKEDFKCDKTAERDTTRTESDDSRIA